MSKIQDAVALAKQWAADSSHGYDQAYRWGPDYDCSSFVITVLELSGIKVKTAGATYTGNMRAVFTRCGFEVITSWTVNTLQPGDVLLNDAHHTAMYIGNGQIVQAGSNENGTATGGQTGDQTGREIAVQSYYNFPWNCVLRYVDKDGYDPINVTSSESAENTYTVKPGDSWWSIAAAKLGSGTKMGELAAINGKTTMSVIHPGDILYLSKPKGNKGEKGEPGLPGITETKEELEAKVKRLGGSITWQ